MLLVSSCSRRPSVEQVRVLKGKNTGLHLRGEIYWFAKQVNGRRSMVSLETRDYVEAVQRAWKIMAVPELQPAQLFQSDIG
jgi:hypothetical protein